MRRGFLRRVLHERFVSVFNFIGLINMRKLIATRMINKSSVLIQFVAKRIVCTALLVFSSLRSLVSPSDPVAILIDLGESESATSPELLDEMKQLMTRGYRLQVMTNKELKSTCPVLLAAVKASLKSESLTHRWIILEDF